MNEILKKKVSQDLWESINTKKIFWEKHEDAFWKVAQELVDCVQRGGKVLIFGNGGSACDAMHFAGEWINRFRADRRPLPAMALTSDGPLLTCIANDFGFDYVFEKQVEGLARSGDVVIGISTSGNSPNVVLGLKAAHKVGAVVIALTGGNGGKLVSENLAKHVLNVDFSKDTPRIQETHEWILHELCEVVEAILFP
jgi:D-sedoheptulose 7-phosphate isomerase